MSRACRCSYFDPNGVIKHLLSVCDNLAAGRTVANLDSEASPIYDALADERDWLRILGRPVQWPS